MPRTRNLSSTRQLNRRPNHKTDSRPLVGANLERCLYCAGPDIVRAGKRYKQQEILQRWFCHQCAVSFSPRTAGKGSTYPLKAILEALCHFDQGHTTLRTADYIRRHDEIQRFMLITDSVTVAVEVPIILTPDDITHMQRILGFDIPIEIDATLTGHIDVLQIRNGRAHILDYKPGATKEKPIAQLMVYALALSRRTGLRLYDFVCAWFDEHHYYEFHPLYVVQKRRR